MPIRRIESQKREGDEERKPREENLEISFSFFQIIFS